MDVEVIKNYQRWASRGYVSPLTCKNHTYHDLLPLQKLNGIQLTCPRGDYTSDLGLSDYLAIKRKAEMAAALWNINNSQLEQ